jgi:hypothetical protein
MQTAGAPPMHLDEYTPDCICRCLGLAGFGSDLLLAAPAGEAMRMLLMPSFHPEVCITIAADGPGGPVATVVAARSMVWHLATPAAVPADRGQGRIDAAAWRRLLAGFAVLAGAPQEPGAVIDGMPVETLAVRPGQPPCSLRGNAGGEPAHAAFVAGLVPVVWHSLSDSACRNALAQAGKYVGIDLPVAPAPERQPTIETVVLGAVADKQELLDALKTFHRAALAADAGKNAG